jgi:hypothetical protein
MKKGRVEELHPDLVRHLHDDGMVHHKLVVSYLDGDDASRINRCYLSKLDGVKKAATDGDWRQYVYLHERPYRFNALVSAARKGLEKKPAEFWALVGYVWQDSENIRQHLSAWKRLWAKHIEGRRACMSKEDLAVFDALPEQIDVWRGTGHKRGLAGISWSLEEKKATYFAQRFWPRVPLVARGIVKKSDVLAYFDQRNEREIVSMGVRTISVNQLQPQKGD